MANSAGGKAGKSRYVDNGWPTTDPDDHAVSELVTDRTGALSPFGDLVFPVEADHLPYIHPVTVINRAGNAGMAGTPRPAQAGQTGDRTRTRSRTSTSGARHTWSM